MKITDIQGFYVKPGYFFIKVSTDQGLCGWGESAILYTSQLQLDVLEEIKKALVGKSPLAIESLWNIMFECLGSRVSSLFITLLSGVDQALWDIKGKKENSPVYDFFGGSSKDKAKLISWIRAENSSKLAKKAKAAMDFGSSSVKISARDDSEYIDSYKKMDEVIERVALIREATDTYFGISVDFHGKIHRSIAKVMVRELDPYGLTFIEDPIPYDNLESLKKIAQYTSVPLATGEEIFSRWGFRKVLQNELIDIIQPSVVYTGGITEARKVVSMAEPYDVGIIMHCSLGPIAFCSSLHVGASGSNPIMQEENIFNPSADPLAKKYIKNIEDFVFQDGYINLIRRPGIGIEVDEDCVRENLLEIKN
ncbi:MAG: galactonate dehydratase [Spirochaetales bacterium]|nr:galactonate dehydratase [Spirochaetales bacterium]